MKDLQRLVGKWPRFTLSFALQACLNLYASEGSDPDVYFSSQSYVRPILSVLLVSLFAESLGGLLLCRSSVSDSLFAARLALGAAALGFLMTIAGLLGWIGIDCALLYVFLQIALALLMDRFGNKEYIVQYFSDLIREPRSWLLLLLLPSVYFSLFPMSYSDPLYYHLRAADLWYASGAIFFDERNPLFFLSGIWEGLYLLLAQYVRPNGTQGLIEFQIGAQLGHLIWGAVPSLLLVFAIAKRWLGFQNLFAISVCACFLFSNPFWEVGFVAKNDWGVLSFASLSIFLLLMRIELRDPKDWFSNLLSGFLFGVVLVSKFTLLPPLVFILAIVLWRLRSVKSGQSRYAHSQSFTSILPLVVGATLGAMPILLRNYLTAGIWLFPVGSSSVLSETDQLLFASFRALPGAYPIASYGEQLLNLFQIAPALLFIPLLVWRFRSLANRDSTANLGIEPDRTICDFLIAGLGVVVWQILFVSPALGWRLSSLAIILLLLVAFSLLQRFVTRWNLPQSLLSSTAILLILLTAGFSGTFGNFLEHLSKLKNPALMIREHQAGDAFAWARMSKNLEGDIYFGGNNLLYYLGPISARTIETDPELDISVRDLDSPEAIVRTLHEKGGAYFVETYGPVPWGRSARFLNPLLNRCRECIVFAGHSARVASIPALVKYISQESYQPTKLGRYRGLVLPKQK